MRLVSLVCKVEKGKKILSRAFIRLMEDHLCAPLSTILGKQKIYKYPIMFSFPEKSKGLVRNMILEPKSLNESSLCSPV